jgi:hypothetical protein
MNNKLILGVFWTTVVVFLFIICATFIPIPILEKLMSGNLLFIILALFFLLGAALITLTLKVKITGKIKALLLLTGASAAGMPVFIVLHNVASGLWHTEEPVFFILATIICPLAFLVGAFGMSIRI